MPLFRRKKREPQHAVLIHVPLSDDAFGTPEERDWVHRLADEIETAIAGVGGEYDGDEFGGGEVVLFTYGTDADALFAALRSCFDDAVLPHGAYAIKRYGEPDDPHAREERIALR